MALKEYRRKRKFDQTPEPTDEIPSSRRGSLRFVIQKHAASREHYDFRLELEGVLKSWAVPKGPTLTSSNPRLAVQVEDHPMKYGKFEGVIPKGNYGAGTVMIWDSGTYTERGSHTRKESEKALKKGIEAGHITFLLEGKKLKGEFALVKLKRKDAPENGWLLLKKHDAHASRVNVLNLDRSAVSGRTMKQIAEEATSKGEVWLPKRKVAKVQKISPVRSGTLMPRKTKVMQPLSTSKLPEKGKWIFENFNEGARAVAEVESSNVKLYSRMFLPFEKKQAPIVAALAKLGVQAVFDGEIIQEKKNSLYCISDLLFLNGKDLRSLPLKERKKKLASLSKTFSDPLRLKPFFDEAGDCSSPFTVAKRLDSIYQSGISKDWLQFKKVVSTEEKPPLTHLTKVFWPKEGYTKGDLVKYYDSIAEYILPYLYDRPESLHRQPNGLKDEGFFHKDITGFLPKRIQTEKVYSESSRKTINYIVCQDRWTLFYLVNLGCIELNPWLSRRGSLENPDYIVIDIDPDENDFEDVVKTALEVRRVLESVGAASYCKTSGASGLHICVPTGARYSFEEGRIFAEKICKIIHGKFPLLTSVERNPARRKGKIYLDFLQNRRGQTLAAPYSVRPRPGATVSAPLKWSEVKKGLRPTLFTIENMKERLLRVGDLWKPMLDSSVDLEKTMLKLSKLYHI